jgi:hypothetical protein
MINNFKEREGESENERMRGIPAQFPSIRITNKSDNASKKLLKLK